MDANVPTDTYTDWLKTLAEELAGVRRERGEVYGDPVENHKGIAMMIAPLLQPHAEAIGRMEPLPPSVVCRIMVALKLNRTRLRFHADNYRDLLLFAAFAAVMQEAEDGAGKFGSGLR